MELAVFDKGSPIQGCRQALRHPLVGGISSLWFPEVGQQVGEGQLVKAQKVGWQPCGGGWGGGF